MTQEHPITPPPELVQKWWTEFERTEPDTDSLEFIATQAARWGADQELEACITWLLLNGWGQAIDGLRADRRPKPPSLKEQALEELKNWTDKKHGPGGEVFLCEGLSVAIIRRALDSLPD